MSSIHPSVRIQHVRSRSSAIAQGYLDVSGIHLGHMYWEAHCQLHHVMEKGQSPNASLVIRWEIPSRCHICQGVILFCDLEESSFNPHSFSIFIPKEDPTPPSFSGAFTV